MRLSLARHVDAVKVRVCCGARRAARRACAPTERSIGASLEAIVCIVELEGLELEQIARERMSST